MLPSGLPEQVADEEDLSRFLTQSSHCSGGRVKPSAFLPPEDGKTSVFRIGKDQGLLKTTWRMANAAKRALHGVAVFKAAIPRKNGLEVLADEPPARHANVERWPDSNDPELRKASRKEIAAKIAAETELLLLRGP